MNAHDRIMIALLTLKDKILNIVTLGYWSRSQGSQRVYCYRSK